MTIEGLRYFITVANFKSITEAADKLYISPQGLSQKIRRLEDELNIELFTRTANGIRLSKIGMQLYDHAVNLVAEADNIADCAAAKVTNIGRLRFAVSRSRCGDTLTSELGGLCSEENVIAKFLTYATQKEKNRLLAAREADIIFLYRENDFTDINWVYKTIAKLYCQPVINRRGPLAAKAEAGTLTWTNFDNVIITTAREKWTHEDELSNISKKYGITLKTNYCYDTSYCIENVRKNTQMVFFATRYLKETISDDDEQLLYVKMNAEPLYKELVAAVRAEWSGISVVNKILRGLSASMSAYSPL